MYLKNKQTPKWDFLEESKYFKIISAYHLRHQTYLFVRDYSLILCWMGLHMNAHRLFDSQMCYAHWEFFFRFFDYLVY